MSGMIYKVLPITVISVQRSFAGLSDGEYNGLRFK